jgi:Holliday junction DNA helicase RuvA
MIAKLTGRIDSITDGTAIIDVGGVGYLVSCSARTLSALAPGAAASLLIETQVREDAIQLFGFTDGGEQLWFRRLITVQGVGAKAALAILSAVSADDLVLALASGDRTVLMRAVGVGTKLAARIVAELKDRVPPLTHPGAGGGIVRTPAGASGPGGGGATQDAVSALVHLGFLPAEAYGAIASASARLGAAADLEALIRGGLAELSPREARP